jgi:hypothetical protein
LSEPPKKTMYDTNKGGFLKVFLLGMQYPNKILKININE